MNFSGHDRSTTTNIVENSNRKSPRGFYRSMAGILRHLKTKRFEGPENAE